MNLEKNSSERTKLENKNSRSRALDPIFTRNITVNRTQGHNRSLATRLHHTSKAWIKTQVVASRHSIHATKMASNEVVPFNPVAPGASAAEIHGGPGEERLLVTSASTDHHLGGTSLRQKHKTRRSKSDRERSDHPENDTALYHGNLGVVPMDNSPATYGQHPSVASGDAGHEDGVKNAAGHVKKGAWQDGASAGDAMTHPNNAQESSSASSRTAVVLSAANLAVSCLTCVVALLVGLSNGGYISVFYTDRDANTVGAGGKGEGGISLACCCRTKTNLSHKNDVEQKKNGVQRKPVHHLNHIIFHSVLWRDEKSEI